MSREQAIKTFASDDGTRRAFVMVRTDGMYRFLEESEDFEDGETFWTLTHVSGLYASVEAAERDACLSLPWLRDQISN